MKRMRGKKVLVLVREGTGRPSRTVSDLTQACSPTQVRRLRDAALNNMAAPEWGWEIGRLYLAGKITADQFEAGKRWRRLVTGWRTAWGIPAASTKPLSVYLSARDDSPDSRPRNPSNSQRRSEDEEAERGHELLAALREAHATVSAYGRDVEAAVRSACEDDAAVTGENEMNSLSCGLGALSSLWSLTT